LSKTLKHLTVEAVKAVHREVLAAHGGAAGIRDETLLESAVAAPQATTMGQPLISDSIEIAAAYLFYICRNHPFLDGNKRTALAACLVFLETNQLSPIAKLPVAEQNRSRDHDSAIAQTAQASANGATGMRDMAGEAVRVRVERSGSCRDTKH